MRSSLQARLEILLACFGRGLGEPALHRVRVHHTGLLELQVAAGEYGKVRNALDVVACGKFREALGVDLDDDRASCEVARDWCHMRRRHAARATPRRPEIDEHRNFAFANDFVELRGIDLEWVSDRRQW